MLFGCGVSIRHRFNKVVFDPLSEMTEAFTISDTLRFSFDCNAFGHAAVQVNGDAGHRALHRRLDEVRR